MNAIEYLINNKDKYKLNIIDDRKNHNIVQIFFPKTAIIKLTLCECNFINVESIIWNNKVNDICVCIEDDYVIGYINSTEYVQLIKEPYSKNNDGEILYQKEVRV